MEDIMQLHIPANILIFYMPIPVTALSKSWVCGHWFSGIAGAGGPGGRGAGGQGAGGRGAGGRGAGGRGHGCLSPMSVVC